MQCGLDIFGCFWRPICQPGSDWSSSCRIWCPVCSTLTCSTLRRVGSMSLVWALLAALYSDATVARKRPNQSYATGLNLWENRRRNEGLPRRWPRSGAQNDVLAKIVGTRCPSVRRYHGYYRFGRCFTRSLTSTRDYILPKTEMTPS